MHYGIRSLSNRAEVVESENTKILWLTHRENRCLRFKANIIINLKNKIVLKKYRQFK